MKNLLVFSRDILLKSSLVFTLPRRLLKAIGIVFIIFVLFSLIFYLFQVSSMLKAGFLLNNYEYKLIEANQQNKALEIKLDNVISLNNAKKLIKEANFEKIENISYIKISQDSIAARKIFINR